MKDNASFAPLPMEELEEKLGYRFKNPELLREALSHSSFYNEMRGHGVENAYCNERLEFLGDSVLSVIVSGYLFRTYAENMEGDLTKIRASAVCEKALAAYAAAIGLGDYLYLGRGEEMNDGRHRPSITSDAFEAVLAAIYLDSGEDCEPVARFLMPHVVRYIGETEEKKHTFIDAKTALQQIIQEAAGERLEYVLVSERGPDHNKSFEIEARLNSNIIGRGIGHSKREAEQAAAAEALVLFGGKSVDSPEN